jgi:hypothetical protein
MMPVVKLGQNRATGCREITLGDSSSFLMRMRRGFFLAFMSSKSVTSALRRCSTVGEKLEVGPQQSVPTVVRIPAF